jgi:hypothetical protein
MGKMTFLNFYQKSMGLLPTFFTEKNRKKRFVIKKIYFYFIFIVSFYNKLKIIEKIRKTDFCCKRKK